MTRKMMFIGVIEEAENEIGVDLHISNSATRKEIAVCFEAIAVAIDQFSIEYNNTEKGKGH